MKLTEQDKNLFKETHDKWLNEAGWLAKIFLKRATKDIKSNKDIQKSISDADRYLEKSRKSIEKTLDNEKELVKKRIPADVRKYLGFDY